VVSHHGVVKDATDDALMRMAGLVAVALPLVALLQVLTNPHDYRQPAVAVAVWLSMFPIGYWLVPRVRAGGLGRREVAAAILIAITAVAVVGWEQRAHYAPGRVDLAILGTAWLLALVALSAPVWVWAIGALAVLAAHAVLVIRAEGTDQLTLTELVAAGYVAVTVLRAFAALRPTMTAHAAISAQRSWLASRSVAERAAADAVQEDRHNALALLELEALPLLRAIADGTLDPTDEGVRERCALHAAALRQFLTDRAPHADGLLSALEPIRKTASARGVLLEVRGIGDPGIPSPQVAQAIVQTVAAFVGALPPHHVLLTVLAAGEDVELYLTYDKPPPEVPDLARFGRGLPAAARWRACVTAEETGAGYLQLSWRKAVSLDRGH
jgi:hypothetical protein